MESSALELDIGRTQPTPRSSCRNRRNSASHTPCGMPQGDKEPQSPAWLQEIAPSRGMAPKDRATRGQEQPESSKTVVALSHQLQPHHGGDVPTQGLPPRPGTDTSPCVAWGRGLRTASLAGSGKEIQRLGSPALADGRPLRCPRCTPVPVPAAGCYSN